MTRPVPRPGIEAISPYVPTKGTAPCTDKIYKLASNESALGASPKAMDAYRAAAQEIHLYPDGGATDLREALAGLHGLEVEQLICSAGSDELIMLMCRSYLGPGDTIVQTRHGFSMYHIYARACGAETIFAPEQDLTADVAAIVDAVQDTTRLVFLANPNNPTGTMINAEEITDLRARLREDIILILDGAYAEFMAGSNYEDGASLVRASVQNGQENVVMLRTFSKAYGLGGLRVGWGYFPPSIAAVLNKVRSPFNVSAASLAAGLAAVRDQAFLAENLHHNEKERARLAEAIGMYQLPVVPSHTNFLLFQTKDANMASALTDFMASKGVLIRAMGGYFLPDYVRVSIGSVEANDVFLDVLKKFMAGAHR